MKDSKLYFTKFLKQSKLNFSTRYDNLFFNLAKLLKFYLNICSEDIERLLSISVNENETTNNSNNNNNNNVTNKPNICLNSAKPCSFRTNSMRSE